MTQECSSLIPSILTHFPTQLPKISNLNLRSLLLNANVL
jgi:hypothetical protein